MNGNNRARGTRGAAENSRDGNASLEYDCLVSGAKELISKALGARPKSEELTAWALFLNAADKDAIIEDPARRTAISAAARGLESAAKLADENHLGPSRVKATAMFSFAAYCAATEYADAICIGKIYAGCAAAEPPSLERDLREAA